MRIRLLVFILACSCGIAMGATEYPGSIQMANGTPTLHIDNQPIYASALRWILNWGSIDQYLYQKQYGPMQQFGEAGVPVIMLGMDAGWKGPNRYDYRDIDRGIDKVLTDYPDAWLIPSIHLEYTRWYASAYPEEAFTIKGDEGMEKKSGSIIASFNSRQFETDAKEALLRFEEHMTSRGYTKRIIGYQINYGATAEWRYWNSQNRPDWNPHAITAWRTFVKKKYETITRLNSAWQTSLDGFEDVQPPDGNFRHTYHSGYLRDPIMDAQVTDYAIFVDESIAALMQSFTSYLKQVTDHRALIGVYSFNRFPAQRLKAVDFSVSSTFYPDRAANGTSLSQTRGLEAHRRLGKLYWHDADMRTYLWPEATWGVAHNVYESVMMMRREFSSMLVNGAGNIWLNLHHHRNVFDNPTLMNTVAELEAAASTVVSKMHYNLTSTAEIAVIYDRISHVAFWGNSALYNNYTRIGAMADFFPSDLLELVDPDQYKLIVMVSCPALSKKARNHLERLKGGNRTLLFLYANGMETEQGLSLKAAEEVCGFQLSRLPGLDRIMNIVPAWQSKFGAEITALGKITGPAGAFRLTVKPQPGDEVIGVSAIDSEPLFVRHAYPDWTAVYFHNYQTYPRILRQIAKQADVTIHFPYDDSYFQRNRHLWLVSSAAGTRNLHVGDDREIYDIFNDRLLIASNACVELEMQQNETKLLLSDTPERIQQFRRHYQDEKKRRRVSFPPDTVDLTVLPKDKTYYLLAGAPRQLTVSIHAAHPLADDTIIVDVPEGWLAAPIDLDPMMAYEKKTYPLSITADSPGKCRATLQLKEKSTGKMIAQQSIHLVAKEWFHLSDLSYASGTTGWGAINRDASCLGRPLRVGDQTFQKGIGVHALSELTYNLDGTWRKLTGAVGVDRATGQGHQGVASCEFWIYGDDHLLFHNPSHFGGEPPVSFEVDLIDIRQLKLVLGDQGDGTHRDHGNWCDMRLYPKE